MLAAGAMAWAHSTSSASLEEPSLVGRGKWAGLAQHVVLCEVGRVGQTEFLVEDVQSAGIKVVLARVDEAGIVTDIGHGDGLAGAVADDTVAEIDIVNTVAPATWAGA